jgi:O-acetyl-ADP-ribose deacetylase (regulator of RNase III)
MIEEAKGNLIKAEAEVLVNTVNTVGVMGKGIALQFRQAFPQNFAEYQAACRRGEVRPGSMFVTHTGRTEPRLIVNFPTKRHWRGKSNLEDIETGLQDLVRVLRREGVRSVAVPPLGCGLGGLDWSEVRPKIVAAFAELPQVRVLLYAPEGSPAPEEMPVATERPAMTTFVATIIALLERYRRLGYTAGKLQIQKLVYLLSEAGEPLKVGFVKGKYGPYDPNLDKGLRRYEGHYIRGFGDGTNSTALMAVPGCLQEADDLLARTGHLSRIEKVADLIEGFETPYGLELLTTVHWVCTKEDLRAADDFDLAVRLFHGWNPRKASKFPVEHIRVAWNHLRDRGWIGGSRSDTGLA